MTLTKSQKWAVDKMLDAYSKRAKVKRAWFKAPTGSGKTFMASEFISRVLGEWAGSGRKTIVVFMTISTAELPKQLATKLKDYRKYHNFKKYNIEFIDSPSKSQKKIEDLKEFQIKNNKIFVLGVSSFGKNTLFHENKTLDTFLHQLKALNYNLIFLRDEAHIGLKSVKGLNKKLLNEVNQKLFDAAEFILTMTATPPKNAENMIVITNDDLKNDDEYLLKGNMALKGLRLAKEIGREVVEEDELIEFAIRKFKESQKEYESLDLLNPIRPALLIQVNNDSLINEEIKRRFHDCLASIEEKLKKYNLTYLVYFGDKKEVKNPIRPDLPPTLEYASKDDSWIDAVILKVGPTVGWDIPRANTLLQLRGVQSPYLTVQTLGRIKRNPYPELKYNEITDKYFVYFSSWPDESEITRDIVSYALESSFEKKKLKVGRITQDEKTKKEIIEAYKNTVRSFIKSDLFIKDRVEKYPKDQVIFYEDWCNYQIRVRFSIENEIYVKIANTLNFGTTEAKNLLMSDFFSDLKKLQTDRSFEVVKYQFYACKNILKGLMKSVKARKPGQDIYQISASKELVLAYDMPKPTGDKERGILSNVDNIVNYGYHLVGSDDNIQYLDSWPEKIFLDTFKREILHNLNIKLDFFAKMPKAKDIYFEYWSNEEDHEIKRSYIDFAIEYKNRIIMVEVKSNDQDYNSEKTKLLKKAYQKYMLEQKKQNKKTGKQLYFVVYSYNHEHGYHVFDYMLEDGKWQNAYTFTEAFKNLLSLQ